MNPPTLPPEWKLTDSSMYFRCGWVNNVAIREVKDKKFVTMYLMYLNQMNKAFDLLNSSVQKITFLHPKTDEAMRKGIVVYRWPL